MNTSLSSFSQKPINEIDVHRIRDEFPILSLNIKGKPLVFLDNAASSQMPQIVMDRWLCYQRSEHANIHRAVHYLSETATAHYEAARTTVQRFINARQSCEIIFTSGTTESINLVAQSWGRQFLKPDDEIILTTLEHHSNIVPWQMVAQACGAKIRVVPMFDNGELDLEAYAKLFNSHTKIACFTHVSNALGTLNPVAQMVATAREHGVVSLVDGAQAVPHLSVDVQALDCDFYVFSGHKLCGPTGIGVLYAKASLLESMPPYKGGGDMILSVSFEKTTYAPIPAKFEAGTPPIAAAITMAAAIDYLSGIGLDRIQAYETRLLQYATEQMKALSGVSIIGMAAQKAAVLSFKLDGVHPHDVGSLLNDDGVAIRTGHHCAQPVMQRLKIAATSRASFAFYNTFAEVDVLIKSIERVKLIFG
jgi:cysteine desulfurase/selenocysteine lyase